jgi:uncharacterized membrane protein YgcG
MTRWNISSWDHIRKMCRSRWTCPSDEEVEIMATEMARVQARHQVAAFEHEGNVAQQNMVEVVEAVAQRAQQALQQKEQAVASEAAAAAVRAERHEAAMTLLGPAVCNAATIIVQDRRRAAAAVDTTANAEKATRDKVYRAADDASEEDRVAEAATLAMAWSLLGKEEEEDWQVRKMHRRSTTRDLNHREHREESSAATEKLHDAAGGGGSSRGGGAGSGGGGGEGALGCRAQRRIDPP